MYGLIRDSSPTPRSVALRFEDEALVMTGPSGNIDRVPYSRLRLVEGGEGRALVKRGWPGRFTLALSGSAAAEAIGRLGPPVSRARRVGRWLWRNPRLGGVLVALPLLMIDLVPAGWMAAAVPRSLERRMEEKVFDQISERRCNSPTARQALDQLIRKLGSEPSQIDVTTIVPDGILISARPGGRLLIAANAITETDPEVFAALLAHELAHLRHGDPMRAVARWEGAGLFPILLFPPDQPHLLGQAYSKAEENRADREALRALERARISVVPVVEFLGRAMMEGDADRMTARHYREAHPITLQRIARWSAASRFQQHTRPPLERDPADELFNICWAAKQVRPSPSM